MLKDYDLVFWAIQEDKNSPLGVDRYYPLMKMIMKNNKYDYDIFTTNNGLSYFNYIIRSLCKDMNNLEEYYNTTLKVCKVFKKLYEEDKENALNIKAEELIKIIKECD
jgi:arabinogalactan endo-1,4-beta-galactosidase